MQRIILLFLILSLSCGKVFSQCAETNKPKVLLIGDSWAFMMNTESTIDYVLKQWGHSNYKFVSNTTVSQNGADTKDFIQPGKQNEIRNLLNQYPSIEVVHVSIGGNDFLGDWKVSNTQGQTDTLTMEIMDRLDSIFRFIKTCRPGIKIFWSGYVYTNFKEVIEGMAPFQSLHLFYDTWASMEFPDFIQINTLQNDMSTLMEAKVAADPDLAFVNCSGLMQYIYGQSTPLGVPPGGTYPAYSVPLPLGDPNYPSPKGTMRNYGFALDCYHLSTQAFRDFVGYHTQKFYHKFLMDDLYLLSENNSQTGTVTSLGNTSDSLVVGESGGEQFASVLSFNTTSMADTTLSKASIFLCRKMLTGTNPIGANLTVKVKSGNFGATVNVEAADFNAADDANGTPCQFGSNTANGDWIRLDLPASVLPHITNTGSTQFIISAPSATGGRVSFYNSADPDFAPVLNLVYSNPATSIEETILTDKFSIYPNPTAGLLTIENGAELITHLEVCNLLGETVLVPQMQNNSIDVSSLADGIYLLKITTRNGKAAQRIIKD